jgi:5-methylcytosine-specific restriction endonuclease McrA
VNVLDRKVLVLNRSWFPVNITTSFHAVSKLFMKKALVVDDDYSVFSLDGWIKDCSEREIDFSNLIRCHKFSIEAPDVIILTNYNGFKRKRSKLSRAAIFARDDNTCQYCNKKMPRKRMNIDHISPKSKGGRSTWENLVVSCYPCNIKKGDRTLDDSGMSLISKPEEPHWSFKGVPEVPSLWLELMHSNALKTAKNALKTA